MQNSPLQKQQLGFSLIEFSILLAVLGLLTSGIYTASSLLKQAQLRSVMSELQYYKIVYDNFVQKYEKSPGDFDRASSIWSINDTTEPACASTNNPNDCNGDGNGLIEWQNGAVANEGRRAWRHIVSARMMEQAISIISSNANANQILYNQTVPSSRVKPGSYIMLGYLSSDGSVYNGTTSPWNNTGFNSLWFGSVPINDLTSSDPYGGLSSAMLSADEAFEIDQKMDDGSELDSNDSFTGATTGLIRVVNDPNYTCAIGNAYQLSLYQNFFIKRKTCVLGFQLDR